MSNSELGAGPPNTMLRVVEKVLPSKCKPDTLCYCPTMDLIALATEDESVHVFRFNNQRVFGADFSGVNLSVKRLAWKDDGQMLAVGLSDLSLRLLNSFSGRIVHTFPTTLGDPKSMLLTHLLWTSHFTTPSETTALLKNASGVSPGKFTLDDLLSTTAQAPDLVKYAKADLPRALSALDIETSLLKLSTLPATGGDDDVFSSRPSLDAIFHTTQHMPSSGLPNDTVDVLSMCSDHGTLHIKIFDCFEIGDVSIPLIPDNESSAVNPSASVETTISLQASHPLSPTNILVVREQKSDPKGSSKTFLLPLTLQFLLNTVPHLSLVAQKCTHLTNILRYLRQVQQQIEFEWRTAQDLPNRFIRNVEDDLANQEGANAMDFKTAVYHLAMTGDCPLVMKEWLRDQVGDRGIKRWEKAVIAGYETLRRLIHECLIPAVERAEVITSRLFGLASYAPAAQALGLDVQRVEQVRDVLDCLNLLGEKLLLRVGKEYRAFDKFIRWLKLEIEIHSAEEGGQTWEELCEGRDSIDVFGVLGFVSGTIGERNISDFIDERKKPEDPSGWVPSDPKAPFYPKYKAMIRPDVGAQDVPKLHDLTCYLTSVCDTVFGSIGETLKGNILFGKYVDISSILGGGIVVDLRIVVEEQKLRAYFVAVKRNGGLDESDETEELRVIRADLETTGGLETAVVSHFSIPGISDARFVDDRSLFALSATSRRSAIMELQYRDIGAQPYVRHAFEPQILERRPIRMAINGRKGRRAAVVLDQDSTRYTVFDIDNGSVDPEEFTQNEGGEGMGMDDEMEMVE